MRDRQSYEEMALRAIERAKEREARTGIPQQIQSRVQSRKYKRPDHSRIVLIMHNSLKRILKLAAEKDRRSMTSYCLRAIERQIERDGLLIEHERLQARNADLRGDHWTPPGLED